MNKLKIFIIGLSCMVLFSGCESWSNTTNGAILGSFGGAVLGAGIGAAIGGDVGADIGSNIGATVGTVAGASIGAEADAKAMARAQQQYEQPQSQQGYSYVDEKGNTFIRLTQENDIIFQSRSSKLDQQSLDAIHDISKNLKKMKGVEVYVYGSTDDVESRDYSEQLSLDRARAVAGYLMGCGIEVEKIHVRGLGAQSPLADNSTMEGRAMNRCAEIYIKK